MKHSPESFASSPVLRKEIRGRSAILFTQKALTHILQEHSQSHGTEKAKAKGKICFQGEADILEFSENVLPDLVEELEFRRKNRFGLPSYQGAPISYLPVAKNYIVQLKLLAPSTFEIVSFYQKRDLKKE